MTKELIVSSTSHESTVALIEDDQLVEIYIARGAQHGLAGSIYKGRVTRVLPGMQSAFVNIGLDRDAFLYVSDFVGEIEEMEEAAVDTAAIPNAEPVAVVAQEPASRAAEPAAAPERTRGREGERDGERDGRHERRGRRSRRRRGRGGQFPDSKYARVDEATETRDAPTAIQRPERQNVREEPVAEERGRDEESEFTVLPGESLAKYSSRPSTDRRMRDFREAVEEEDPAGLDGNEQFGRGRELPEDFFEDSEGQQEKRGFSAEPGGEDSGGEARPRWNDSEPESVLASAEEFSGEPEDESSAAETLFSKDADRQVAKLDEAFGEDDGPEADGNYLQGRPAMQDGDESEDSELALDDSETEEVREAIREALEEEDFDESAAADGTEEEDSDEREAAEDEEDPAAIAAQPGEPGDGGSREARVREGGGTSRYLHRRGGRRGRRRGRSRGPQQSPEAETPAAAPAASPHTSISELLTAGQEILVQISKEPLGKKGARITSHIAMPGRYLVYMPTVDHVGVSRKIAHDSERLRLRKIVQGHRTGMPGGFIVRTAGDGASEEEIRGDMLFLYNLWLDIRQKAEQRSAPALIHQDLDLVERVLRDQLGSEFKTMWVDSESEYERILRFVERFQPKLLSRVKLYTRSKPIFDAFNITPELEKALRPKVWLKSGGYIVINQTEALVAIDVNTGKFVGKSDRLEDTIVKTNLEAVQEIVRQLRLRDLGGIIVVDFIDMDDRKNRYTVMQALEQELRLDRAPSKSLQFNEFGLVAITRKRVKQSLERTLCTSCPYCTGSGYVKSVETVIFEILGEAKKMAPRVRSRKDLTVRVNPEVARALKARENSYLQEIEELFRANVLVRGDVSLHREHFDIN